MDEQRLMKWALELTNQEYGSRISALDSELINTSGFGLYREVK